MKVDEFKRIRQSMGEDDTIVLKFSATWCKPCQRIKPLVTTLVKELPDTVQFYEIDIDESVELYLAFKSKKMIKGVPTMLAFHGNDVWYVPNEIVSGADEKGIRNFFESIE